MRIPFVSLIAASALALGGCAYGGIGLGYGDPYAGYYGSQYGGYGGYGYNSGYAGYGYNSGYGSPYGYGAGYGYGSPYYGWYDGYYYPGSGTYVYGRDGRRHAWSDSHRTYWQGRGGDHRGANWNGFRDGSHRYGQAPSTHNGGVAGGGGHRGFGGVVGGRNHGGGAAHSGGGSRGGHGRRGH